VKKSNVFGDSGLSDGLNASALILIVVAAAVWIAHFFIARNSVAIRITWATALGLALLAEIASRAVSRRSRPAERETK
jgi:hypothetical protein